ncbi:4-hydroxythreonine-4-phosphate dehydrogenase PdxA [Helicobacter sp. 16-1353]|uniref:4-hydroxythreonine-4-phosphate dehydrogenase n=1 Tax=Helicobacter sp. 16-1353 TaxID=2004996 RepID=UPI000DCF30AE|nr:4-hydroxythreonine-4-phosphate dehydrogenase [Helicobacter sp. 16-1353]RAX55170.1 4-hydroxythreonine-4-phosphate dehydrogenase PdxA [Helicobacter sp. 16-1353]
MKKIAISIGDVNGIGLEIALKSHEEIKKYCEPIYFIDVEVVESALTLLKLKPPKDFHTQNIQYLCSQKIQDSINNLINPSKLDSLSGEYSFQSFKNATIFVKEKKADALLTLPIHKKAWELANINFVGHTDFLSHYFGDKGIMMLGCKEMFVALFSDHIPLKEVPSKIKFDSLLKFFIKFANNFSFDKALVLGLNPHAGDNGVLGKEDFIINEAIIAANKALKKEIFIGTISPDIAFSPQNRARFHTFIAMYHDQGLAPLKALYFDESINVTLGLPILRTSVDHGVAFDIAYQNKASIKSYLNAIDFILKN